MAEEGLEGTDVGPILEEMGGERMPEGVAGNTFVEVRLADGIAEFQTVWQYHYGADGRLLQVDLDQNRDGTIESTELNQYDADGKLID